MIFPIRIKHGLDVSVQRSHDPMRANIVGPPDVATRIKASMAACHSAALCSRLRKLDDVIAGILEGDELAGSAATGSDHQIVVSNHDQPPVSIGSRSRFIVNSIF